MRVLQSITIKGPQKIRQSTNCFHQSLREHASAADDENDTNQERSMPVHQT
jgi:hypothetical protein